MAKTKSGKHRCPQHSPKMRKQRPVPTKNCLVRLGCHKLMSPSFGPDQKALADSAPSDAGQDAEPKLPRSILSSNKPWINETPSPLRCGSIAGSLASADGSSLQYCDTHAHTAQQKKLPNFWGLPLTLTQNRVPSNQKNIMLSPMFISHDSSGSGQSSWIWTSASTNFAGHWRSPHSPQICGRPTEKCCQE